MADNSNLKWPDAASSERINEYTYNDKLFAGKHFEAFKIKVPKEFTARYAEIRYITCNFMGLVSKAIADLLFGDEISISVEDGNQEFVDALVSENDLHTQNYESAIANSRRGDALYRMRIGQRNPAIIDSPMTLIIEDINPAFYFPQLDPANVRATPLSETLAYVFEKDKKWYLHKEIHTPGLITNKVFEYDMRKNEIIAEMTDVKPFGFIATQETKIKRSLLFHIPNFKDGSSYFGTSDYDDLVTLVFAVNNRMTKTDNILDKHSDPILAVPDGVIDEEGHIRVGKMNLIEMNEDGTGKPEYIVWDANLQAAKDQLEKLIEMLFMMSEVSPDVMGLGKGQADSGRALKLRMYRTLAKTKRKQIYYDKGLKDLLYWAQELAKAWKVEVGGVKMTGDAVRPVINWPDPLNNLDTYEAAQEEQIRLTSGTTTVVDALMRLDGLTREQAEKKAKDITAEQGANLPLNGNPVDPSKLNAGNQTTKPTAAATKNTPTKAPVAAGK